MFNKKISTPIAILIIIVLAALVGGVFYWQYENVKNIKEPNIKSESKIEKPATLDVSSWENYKDKKYNFEMRYPKSWYTYKVMKTRVFSTFSREKYYRYYESRENKKLGKNIGILWTSYIPNKTLKEAIKENQIWLESTKPSDSPSISPLKLKSFATGTVTVGGIEGYKLSWEGRSFIRFEEGEKNTRVFCSLPVPGKEAVIKFELNATGKNRKDYANVFNKMLSTFKFIKSKEQLNTISKSAPTATVKTFYENWINFDGNPIHSKIYKESDLITKSFVEQIESAKHYDPVVCAQDMPSNFNVELTSESATSTTIRVKEIFGQNFKTIEVNLVKKDKNWLINDVECFPKN